MHRELYRYVFAPGPPAEELEGALLLAILAAEGLHGEAHVRMDGAYHLDAEARVAVVDAGTAVGLDINRLFTQFLRREVGDDGFTVRRVSNDHRPEGAAARKEIA